MRLIKIKGLKFSYPYGKRIFNGLNFVLHKGEKIGLTGPNGSGKTTLFHLIMGLLKPEAGEIKIFGKIRKKEEDFFEVRRKLGLLFQDADDQLFCPTVEENIAFGPLNLGKTKKEVKKIVRETCEKLGLIGLENKVTTKLSSGEKKLVAFSTVIAMKPEVLLLDEPNAGLDEETTKRILAYLKENTKTYIIIAQDYDFLKKATDRIYRLTDSKLEPL